MNRLMRFFKFEHLPVHLQSISRPIAELARDYDNLLPESAEKTTGLRKLLEAKDCFVRALVELDEDSAASQDPSPQVQRPVA